MLAPHLRALALLLCLSACGGSVEDDTGQTNPGTAGTSGGGQAGAGGTGTAGAGAGGSSGASGQSGAAAFDACTTPGTCVLAGHGCCGACDPTAADVSAVHYELAEAFSKTQCAQPVSCGPCPPESDPQGQNLAAFCEQSHCQVVDVRTDDVSSCAQDSDCVVHQAGCCEPCSTGTASDYLALSQQGAAVYQKQVCSPLQKCPACLPAPPPGSVQAVCNAQKHCELKTLTGCPASIPQDKASCSLPAGTLCEFGADLQVGCRPRAVCNAGLWDVTFVDCVPLPTTGEKGCPTSFAVNGQACTNDGLVCDLQSTGPGRLCACTSCGAGGPCSAEPRWLCLDAPSGESCPPVAPNTGAACMPDGPLCIYGLCGGNTSAGRQCQGGHWVDEPLECAL